MTVVPPGILADLAAMRIWAAWRAEERRPGLMAKVPYANPFRRARSTFDADWQGREAAAATAACLSGQGYVTGLGLRLGPQPDGSVLLALDLDAALDSGGQPAQWAVPFLARFARHFAERSQSGRGAHILLRAEPDDLDVLRAELPFRQRLTAWRRPSDDGAKAPALELLAGAFLAVTGDLLPGSPREAKWAARDDLFWLAREGVPQLHASYPVPARAAPARATEVLPAALADVAPPVEAAAAADEARDANAAGWEPPKPRRDMPVPAPARPVPGFRASRSRVGELAAALRDGEWQLLLRLWLGASGKSVDGWCRSAVPFEAFQALPGAEAGSRRAAPTVARTIRALMAKGLVRVAAEHVAPFAGHPGRVRTYAAVAPLVHLRGQPPPDMIRLRRTDAERMLALRPTALRLLFLLLATRESGTPFELSSHEAGRLLRAKREKAGAALAELVAAGWLAAVAAPDALGRRAGRYCLTK